MKTIYVLTSQYMPLIANEDINNPSKRAMKNNKIMHTQDITEELITQTFDKSKSRMLAFNSKEDAVAAMAVGLKGNNTNPDFIDGQILFFAVPVVFTVQVNKDFIFEESRNLTAEMLHSYLETDSIPFFTASFEQGFWKDSAISQIDNKIKSLNSCPSVFSINKADVKAHKVEAFYLAANPVREAVVHFSTAKQDLEKIKNEEAAPAVSSTICSIM
ncbi:TPA: hypothetical protein ACTXXA_003646 [Legionella anisa]